MTDRSIDASHMPSQSWFIVARPSLPPLAASSLPQPPSVPTDSPRGSDATMPPASPSLEERLFENAAELKIALSELVMHLAPQWRTVVFKQLDRLLDVKSWAEDSAFINKSTFMTFLRFIIYALPTRFPSLGVGITGDILAAWNNGSQQIAVEFFGDNHASATFVRPAAHSPETFAWRGHVADLKSFIERNEMLQCIQSDQR
jgi:hypothetical protein